MTIESCNVQCHADNQRFSFSIKASTIDEILTYAHAWDFRSALHEMNEYLRQIDKYQTEDMDNPTVTKIRQRWFEILSECNADID